MRQKQYNKIKSKLKTGDLVAFGGHTFISANIKTITKSNVSHVGIIMLVNTPQANLPIIMIIESTSIGDGFAGVQISRLSTRILGSSDDIWILPIEGPINIPGIETFLVSKLGIPYDYKQAIGSAFDFSFLPEQKEDLNKLFCSELCNEAYKTNLIKDTKIPTNSSEQTPIDVCRLPIYSDIFQLNGSLKELF